MEKHLPFGHALSFSLLLLLMFSLSSCSREDVKANFIDPRLHKSVINTGFSDNVIEVQSENWSVAYVKDGQSGELLKDTDGQTIRIDEPRTAQLKDGWLELEKTKDNNLRMTLAENFSNDPREFFIGLQLEDQNQEMHFMQTRGEHYELLEADVSENKGSRKVYVSDEGCSTLLVRNNTNEVTNVDLSEIFSDVKSTSELLSTDYGAFDWIARSDSIVSLGSIVVGDNELWSEGVPFKEGVSTKPYKNIHSTKLEPYGSIVVKGEMQYLERSSEFTLTIKNVSSGNQFKVSGLWNQKIPLAPHIIFE